MYTPCNTSLVSVGLVISVLIGEIFSPGNAVEDLLNFKIWPSLDYSRLLMPKDYYARKGPIILLGVMGPNNEDVDFSNILTNERIYQLALQQ